MQGFRALRSLFHKLLVNCFKKVSIFKVFQNVDRFTSLDFRCRSSTSGVDFPTLIFFQRQLLRPRCVFQICAHAYRLVANVPPLAVCDSESGPGPAAEGDVRAVLRGLRLRSAESGRGNRGGRHHASQHLPPLGSCQGAITSCWMSLACTFFFKNQLHHKCPNVFSVSRSGSVEQERRKRGQQVFLHRVDHGAVCLLPHQRVCGGGFRRGFLRTHKPRSGEHLCSSSCNQIRVTLLDVCTDLCVCFF